MHSKAAFIFWITLGLYLLTLFTVSYVGVYLTYIAIPIIAISGLIMKITKPKPETQRLYDETKCTLSALGTATESSIDDLNSFLAETHKSLDNYNKKHEATRPIREEILKLNMKRLGIEYSDPMPDEQKINSFREIDAQLKSLEYKKRQIEECF